MRGFFSLDRIGFICFLLIICLAFHSGIEGHEGVDEPNPERRRISVPAQFPWTDTGLDVLEGQLIYFRAAGSVSLQKGNPVAYCGPSGYNLQTVQQPIQDRNLGALIGKVYLLISVEKDSETGEEIRHELSRLFYIGSENRVEMPIKGRLFLGVNENLVQDNDGRFEVEIIFE